MLSGALDAGPSGGSGRTRTLLAVWALLALVVGPVYPHFVSPNELSRWALAASVVERRTLEVSDPVALLGPRFEDVAEVGGRLYSNKAPGLTLVGLPGYLLVRPFTGGVSPAGIRAQVAGMRTFAATLPLALLVLALGSRLPSATRRQVLATLLLGTPLLAYGLLLFAHALVAAALLGAYLLLFPESGEGSGRRDAAAGALLGLAAISEYPAAVPGAVLALTAAAGRWRRLVPLVAGGTPFVALLLAYDARCFGSPFALSSGFERDAGFRQLAGSGLFGVGLPDARIVAALLADPSKGLLVFTPLLLALPWALRAARPHLPPRAFVALIAVPLAVLATYGGYPNWHGGFTVGARYLVAALPFVLVPFAYLRWGALTSALAGASVAAVAVTSLVFPFVPPGFPLPWGSFAAPLLAHGLVAPNLLHLVWRPLAVAAPFLLVGVASVLAFRGRSLVFFALGASLWLGAGLALPLLRPLPPPLVVQRAYVEDVYFERSGALERAMPAGVAVPPRLEQRRTLERTLPPSSWPF